MKKEGLFVSFKVKNVGNFKGSVVGMVFLGFPESVKNYPIRLFNDFNNEFFFWEFTHSNLYIFSNLS